MSRGTSCAWPLGAILAVAAVAACTTPAGGPKDPAAHVSLEKRDTELTHEPCDLASSSAVRFDADGDNRPEIVKVMDGGRELCRAVDTNLDGTIDTFVYFDEQGKPRRREYGFDRDDRADTVILYQGGVVVQKLLETNNDRKVDTWEYFQSGRRVRAERDSTGDGYIDQWWTYNRPDRPECAVVVTDHDGDGQPDKGSELDMCAAPGGEPPPAPAATAHPTAPPTAAPTAPPIGTTTAAATAAPTAAPDAPPPATTATAAPTAAPSATPPTKAGATKGSPPAKGSDAGDDDEVLD